MLAMSLAVVRKMLEAVAGSAPKRFSISGITAPAKPAMVQLADHRDQHDEGEHDRLRLAFHRGIDEHAGGRR